MTLRALLQRPGLLTVPGVFDGLSARLAVAAGFDAVYMTGYGTVASGFGLPDTGLATYSEMLDRVRVFAGLVDVPLIADGDTGYGSLTTLRRTVRGYEQAGAAAIQIEDQCFPKLCGQGPRPVPVVGRDEAARRIGVAVEARRSAEFSIIARTDARRSLGLEETILRGRLFIEAGADMLFVEGLESHAEMQRVGEVFRGVPLVVNLAGGPAATASVGMLADFGYKIALRPVDALLAAAGAMRAVYASIADRGTPPDLPRLSIGEVSALMGFDEIEQFDMAWSGDEK